MAIQDFLNSIRNRGIIGGLNEQGGRALNAVFKRVGETNRALNTTARTGIRSATKLAFGQGGLDALDTTLEGAPQPAPALGQIKDAWFPGAAPAAVAAPPMPSVGATAATPAPTPAVTGIASAAVPGAAPAATPAAGRKLTGREMGVLGTGLGAMMEVTSPENRSMRASILDAGWKGGMRPVISGRSTSFVPEGAPGLVPVSENGRRYGATTGPLTEAYREPTSGKQNDDVINAATGRLQDAAAAGMGIRSGTNAYIGANMTATGMTPEQQHLANLAKTDATKERMMRDTQTVGRIRGNAASAEASRQFDETQKTARAVGLAAGMTPQYTKTAQGVWVDQKGNPAGSDVAGRLDTEEYRGKQLDIVSNLDASLEKPATFYSQGEQYGINRATGAYEVVPVSELNKEDKKRTHDPLPAELRAKLGSARSNFKTIEEVAAALGANKIDRATAEKEYTRIKGAKK